MLAIHPSPRSRLLVTAAPFALMFAANPALAQTTEPASPAQQDQAQQATDQGSNNNDIVVTGTLFRTTKETPSPVTTLTAQTLERANITTINDAIRSVSADSAGSISTGFRNGFSAGGAAVSLRGVGVSSTLVVIDGLRSVNYPLNDDGHNAYVDLNSIPFSIVERVDVLKDGASSTYGADAIGGVVNIITKKHFTGIEGSVQGGVTQRGDGPRYRGALTVGVGDFDAKGWNIYVNGEYQRDGIIYSHDRGFPFNTLDLTPIGGVDKNRADDSLTTATPQAVVIRTSQSDLNNPLAGGTAALGTTYQLLNPSACPFGTFTAAQGTGCRHNFPDEYFEIQPSQERYSLSGRASVRVTDGIEAYVTGSYARNHVEIFSSAPAGIRQTQPFGASPALASSNPGIVLPVYICSSGVNCATAADRRLNPNNPFAPAYAANPSQGAARIYYLFGDIPVGSVRNNEVLRATAGLTGHFGDGWNFRAEGVVAKDNFSIAQYGFPNVAGLVNAINTGAYNFVNPDLNTQAVRDQVAPVVRTPSYSSLVSFDASLAKSFIDLPGGSLNVAVGGQVRREILVNRNQNANLATYALNTSSAFGRHTVYAGFFELDAPVLDALDINVSGRYDHYSEGFSHFSPKVGVKFTPIKQLALRATYSEGFRAPTFAENNAASQYAGFSSFSPPCAFVLAHGGTGSLTACSANGNAYVTSYNIGSGATGNPSLQPEKSRSFTLGAIVQPTRWLSLTVDYYNIKKSNLIVGGPLANSAKAAYYSVAGNTYASASAAAAAGCAAVAAVGPGYSCNVVDAPDPNPAYANALPRLLILNVPFVNANYEVSSGLDVQATATVPLAPNLRFISRVEVTDVLRLDLNNGGVLQKYAGTLGPYELSSGNGTPKWRGNWQNTLEAGPYTLTATAYYVGRIKEVAADEIAPVKGKIDLSCANNLYGANPSDASGNTFCYVRSFIDVDLNAGVKVNDKFRLFVNVQNLFDVKAPVAPAAYTSNPNYLVSWHYQGLVGRMFSAGAYFKF